jgi:hypothetical protein
MSSIKDATICLRWNGDIASLDYTEPSNFVYETEGEIFGSDNKDKEFLIGRFHFYYIDSEAAYNSDISIYDVFDSYQETEEYYAHIFGENAPDFSAELTDLIECSGAKFNVLIVDRLEIFSKYRGKSLGLTSLWKIIHRFGSGVGVVALRPYPLQFEHEAINAEARRRRDEMELNEFTTDIETATGKLEKLYEKLGFVKSKNSSVMFRSNEINLPTERQMITSMRQKL